MGRPLRAVPGEERRVQLRRARHRQGTDNVAELPEDRGRRQRYLGRRGHPWGGSEGSVHRAQHADHRQWHPHHRERAHRSHRGRGRRGWSLDVLLQHDGAAGRRAHRQLRGYRRHSVMRKRPSRPARPRERRPRVHLVGGAFLAALLVVAVALPVVSEPRRYTIAFANLTDEPGAAIEGTGFTGADVRQSFVLAARGRPIDLVLYDNHRDGAKALANVADAIRRKVDLYIQYLPDPAINKDVAEMLRSAGIPVLAVNYPVPGAPLFALDNRAAGRIAGETLTRFAGTHWSRQPTVAVVLGNLVDQANGLTERAD